DGVNQAVSYSFLSGTPVRLTQWASPHHAEELVRQLGIYAQDQWTLRNLSLNLGLRFDQFRGIVPAQTRPAGRFVQAFDIARIDDVPNFKDLSPRLGVAYHLSRNDQTARKGSLGGYVGAPRVE